MSPQRQAAPKRRASAPRRRAAAPRGGTGLGGTGLLGLALVALAAAAALAAGLPGATPVDRPSGAAEPVTHSLAACPQTARPRGTTSQVVAGSVPANGLTGRGSLRHMALGGKSQEATLRRGRLLHVGSSPDDGVGLQADGGIAAGLFGARVDTGTGPATLAVAGCGAPRSDWWFSGAAASLDHTSKLVMANADPGPAVVDVRVYGPAGEVDTMNTRGITIPANSQRAISLADIAPQQKDLAVNVQASRGRVVAAVADAFSSSAGAAPGREWLPDATEPSRTVRLGGVAGHADNRTLVVANPSDLEALVEIRVAGGSGLFTPAGVQPIRVPPGTVRSMDIGGAVGTGPSAVMLHSRVPVVATVRSTTGSDSSYSGMVQPVRGRAVAPLVDGAKATVLLTSDGPASRATASVYDAAGKRVAHKTVRITPGATVAWTAKQGAGYVVVEPQKGSVSGAVSYSGGGASSVPLVTVPTTMQRPAVSPALSE